MKDRSSNFLSYLENNYYDKLENALIKFIKTNKNDLIIDKYDFINVEDIEVYDLGLKNVFIDSKDEINIDFDIQLNPEITYTEIVGKYRTREAGGTNSLWFTISCKAKISNTLKAFSIISVDEYNSAKPKKPLNGNLVPVIRHDEYEKYATAILTKYYPEALAADKPIDAMTLASKMGFKVIKRRISKGRSVFGQIYFENCRIKLFNDKINDYEEVDIPANTIVIDSSTNSAYSFGCENITIAHECVHGYLHRKAFNFARIYNKNLSGLISCTVTGDIRHIDSNSDLSYMESQANGIAPCLLLPKNMLTSRYHRLVNSLMKISRDRLSSIGVAIQELAGIYNVTYYAIKKRLIDLGIDEVIGVNNYVDGNYIRPFAFKKGTLLPNETFIIKTQDLVQLISSNHNLILNKLRSGGYVFVENHLCVNDKKYIQYDEKGKLVLTEFARLNVDECCLKFKFKSQVPKNNDILMYCYLARGTQINLAMDISLSNSSTNILDADVQDRIKKYNELMLSTKKAIRSMTFGEAIDYILKVQNLQIKEVTDIPNDLSSLSSRQFERYKNGETKNLNKRVVVAICLSLNIPPMLSEELIKLAGFSFTNTKDDSMLLTLLTTCRGKKFDEINDMLITLGYNRLTNDRPNS